MTRRDRDWEEVCSTGSGDYTERLRVDGGWLYRTALVGVGPSDELAVALAFVPDPPVADLFKAKLEQLLECRLP